MISVLAFDLGGVLFSDGTREFIEHLNRTSGVDTGRAGELLNGSLGSRYREGRMSRDDFWATFRKTLELSASGPELAARWIDGYRLNEGTRDLIQDYDLYYLSDNVAERVAAIERRYHFLRLFKGGVFSHEVGVRKPDPKIYEILLKKTGAQPQQVLFVDDKEWALAPAEQIGMKTVLFRDSDQVRRAMEQLHIPRKRRG